MKLSEKLNEYIEILNCTAKDISSVSGLSEATISRRFSSAADGGNPENRNG